MYSHFITLSIYRGGPMLQCSLQQTYISYDDKKVKVHYKYLKTVLK